MKRKIASGLCIMLGVLLVACGKEQEGQISNVEQEEKIQIGMCFDSYVIERWQRDRDVFVSTAKDLGAEVNVQNANGNLEEQISQIRYFIEKKVDVLVIISIDADGLSEAVSEAKKAGIKILSYDRLISNADADLYISFDNEMVGELMGTALSNEIGKDANALMLCGPLTDKNVTYVNSGFEKAIQKDNVKIIDKMNTEGWKAELAYQYLNDNYMSIDKVDGIMCGNDDIAGQAVRFLAERRRAGKIPVVGQDADLAACQRIVEGTQLMTVYKPVEKLAQAAAEYAVKMANGEELSVEESINDGLYHVPYVKLEPIAVTANNMSVIIDSGFHLKEDIYLNVPDQMPE